MSEHAFSVDLSGYDVSFSDWDHAAVTGSIPKSIAIVALGNSSRGWQQEQLRKGATSVPGGIDQIWTVNRGFRLWRSDLVFIMDDLEREAATDPEYGAAILAHQGPIVTSKVHDAFAKRGNLHAFPIGQVARLLKAPPYLINSIPCMLALADLIGVESILLCGADYNTPDGRVMEDGRANVEWWLGRLESKGVRIWLPNDATLRRPVEEAPGWLYGYDRQHEVRRVVELALAPVDGEGQQS